MPKYRRRATLQEGHRLDINELRRLGVRMGEYAVTFSRDRAPATLTAFRVRAVGLPRLRPLEAARRQPICLPEVLGRRAAYASQFLTPVDRAHRNIRRIEARLSPVNLHGEDDGCFYRPRGMRQADRSTPGC